MRLFDTFARRGTTRGYHSTIVTTFGIDFAAFEQILLPQFDGAGSGNVVLIADQAMVALALIGGIALPRSAGSRYAVHGVTVDAGVFHPKIVFQVGRDGARVVVGSANATAAGIAGNREVVTEVSCGTDPSPERAFAVAVWVYLTQLVGEARGPAYEALHWLESRTPWLAVAEDDPRERVWSLADGTRLGFLANDPNRSILDRYGDELNGVEVERLIVLSPYWDGGLRALRDLIEVTRPSETKVLIQAARKLFPTKAASGLPVDLLEALPGKGTASDPAAPAGRFSHAKVIIASGGGFDHALAGSANCTPAGLGGVRSPGQNGEACVYRRLPAGAAVELLDLAGVLAGPPLDLKSLPEMVEETPIPMEQALENSPGTFEAEFAELSWRPSPKIDVATATVELLLHPEAPPLAEIASDAWKEGGSIRRAQVMGAGQEARFARVRSAKGMSGVAIVSRHEALKQGRRERSSRKSERVVNEMEEIGLDVRLLELLDILEREDHQTEATLTATRRMGGKIREEGGTSYEKLDYEKFITVRRVGGSSDGTGSERSTLAGKNVDALRALLNNLIGGGADALPDEELVEEELPDNELLGGAAAGKTTENPGAADGALPLVMEVSTGKRAPAPFEPQRYEKAVGAYWKKIQTQAQEGLIGPSQVLRLRTWLMLLLWERRHLACDGSETGWPRLLLRVLAAFFTGPVPPIKRLALDPRYDRLPDDFIEAWIAVVVAVDALEECVPVLAGRPNSARLPDHITRLAGLVRSMIGLTSEDLASSRFQAGKDRLLDYLSVEARSPEIYNEPVNA